MKPVLGVLGGESSRIPPLELVCSAMVLCAWRSVVGCRRSSGRFIALRHFQPPGANQGYRKTLSVYGSAGSRVVCNCRRGKYSRDFVRVLMGRRGFNCGSMPWETGWLLTVVTAPGICLRTQHCWISFAEKSIQSSVSHDTLRNDLGVRTVVVAGRVLKTMLGSLAQGCAAMAAWEGAKEVYAA